jgi:hypothetical protein
VKTTQLLLGIWLSVGVASTLLLTACGGDANTVNPLPVDAGDAAADAPHDGAADAASSADSSTNIQDGGTD